MIITAYFHRTKYVLIRLSNGDLEWDTEITRGTEFTVSEVEELLKKWKANEQQV